MNKYHTVGDVYNNRIMQGHLLAFAVNKYYIITSIKL